MSGTEITPVTEWPEWHSYPNGGEPITQDLNAPYDKGDLYWMLVSTILCWQITPSLFGASTCGIQFWIYAYSLYQSRTTNPMLGGDLSPAGLHNVLACLSLADSDTPRHTVRGFRDDFRHRHGDDVGLSSARVREAVAEHAGPPSYITFCFKEDDIDGTPGIGSPTSNGTPTSDWLYKLGIYDFAGSGPVDIASGFGALAWSLMLGLRVMENTVGERRRAIHSKPHSPFACVGGAGLTLPEHPHSGKFSIFGFCTGIIGGARRHHARRRAEEDEIRGLDLKYLHDADAEAEAATDFGARSPFEGVSFETSDEDGLRAAFP
ncbi:hypothetical protein DL765_004906 [Monosporascus sp. GIB2]|nr:hypothetical protein DL765_004906 [Monosporascus sp. GIB2]